MLVVRVLRLRCHLSTTVMFKDIVIFSKLRKKSLFSPTLYCMYSRTYSKSVINKDVHLITMDEWRKRLSPEQFSVCREKSTEYPFSGIYNYHYQPGTYTCVCCGLALFSSESKYDSGSGWPSFHTANKENDTSNVIEKLDSTSRIEVLCKQCDSHLGHVFDDGPEPTGKRYCINGIALEFKPKVVK